MRERTLKHSKFSRLAFTPSLIYKTLAKTSRSASDYSIHLSHNDNEIHLDTFRNEVMSQKERTIRFHICLTPEEKEQVQRMADENALTISELFRAKTLKNKLPRRVTKIAGQTYWELGKISNDLNQLTQAANTAVSMGNPVVIDLALIEKVRDLVKQVRREITEIDLITEISDEA
jgi:hypothetical protein